MDWSSTSSGSKRVNFLPTTRFSQVTPSSAVLHNSLINKESKRHALPVVPFSLLYSSSKYIFYFTLSFNSNDSAIKLHLYILRMSFAPAAIM